MPWRLPTRLFLFGLAVLLVNAGLPAPVRASGIINANGTANYTLFAPAGLPDPGPDAQHINASVTLPQVAALINPTGGIVPPVINGTQVSPLTILAGSSGFDPNNLTVGLSKDGTGLGLVFLHGGLKAGGILNFALNVNPALTSAPDVTSQTPGVVILPTATPTPEPMSMVLWLALGGIGLARARSSSARRPKAPALQAA